MPTVLQFSNKIKAPIQSVFDASRNIDLHTKTASQTDEKAIAGKTEGLINLNEIVTWRGKHFGIYLKHTSKITELDSPNSFTDEMIDGHFKSFKHLHQFKAKYGQTIMIDTISYEVPYGIFGKFFNLLLLKSHMQNFINQRNTVLKDYLENYNPETT